jgi:acyl carrier protein
VTYDETARLVCEVFGTYLGLSPEAINVDLRLIDDLAIDSIDAVDVLITIEHRTGVQFDVDQLEGIDTVGDVVQRVMEAAPVDSGDSDRAGG